MALRRMISKEGKRKSEEKPLLLALGILAFLLVLGGNFACQKAEEVAEEEGAVATREGMIEFEGTVKVAVGKYMYIPQVQGFDVVVQGPLETGGTGTLVGKEVRGTGKFSPERPSILVANTIEIKESEGQWRNIFTRSEEQEIVLDDYIGLAERDRFEELKGISYDKKRGWEGKEKVRIYGRLEQQSISEEEEEKKVSTITVLDEEGEEIGKILVDNISDFALYYVKKLSMFDRFWFYITVKETVPWSERRRTRELFHADVHFAGLY
ncbi:MAG: hypothetical protein ACLFVG_08645 [Candidatus Aminicenantes bacterium]